MSCKLLFRGLICLRTEDDSAVFIGAEGHELRLIVKNKDLVKPAQNLESDDAHLSGFVTRTPRTAFKIAQKVLHVQSGTEKETSTFDDDYLTFVPSLRKKSACSEVRPEIAERRLGHHIGGYLIHTGGRYSVREFFPEKVTFTGNAEDGECIAMTTSVELKTNGKEVVIGDDESSITVRPDAELLFVNGPVVPPDIHDHFQHYFHAIYKDCHGGQRPMPVDEACPLSRERQPLLPGSDCPSSGDP